MDSGHYHSSNSYARPEQQTQWPEGSRQNSSRSVMSHGQQRQGNHYHQPNHVQALGQDTPHEGFRQNSNRSLTSQGRNQTGGRYQPNYGQTPNQDPRHELSRQTSQHSSMSQGQHLRPGVVPTSAGHQPVNSQNAPRRVSSTGRYPLSEAEQQRALRQQQMAQSMPGGQGPHNGLVRQTSQHSSISHGQHLGPGVVPTSAGQPVYSQNVPRRVLSTERYPLSEAEQQRALRDQQMAQSVPEGLAEGT